MESIIECVVAGLFAVAMWWWMPAAAFVFMCGFVVVWYMPENGYDWAIFEGEE